MWFVKCYIKGSAEFYQVCLSKFDYTKAAGFSSYSAGGYY